MIETLIALGLLGGAAATTGIPQKFINNHKGSLEDFSYWAMEKYHRFSKIMGFSNPRKVLEFEKNKSKRNIEKLINVISNYEALKEELEDKNTKDEDIKELLLDKVKEIEEKINIAKFQLEEQKSNYKDLIDFIVESDNDKISYKIQDIDLIDNKFLMNKIKRNNRKGKKNEK